MAGREAVGLHPASSSPALSRTNSLNTALMPDDPTTAQGACPPLPRHPTQILPSTCTRSFLATTGCLHPSAQSRVWLG